MQSAEWTTSVIGLPSRLGLHEGMASGFFSALLHHAANKLQILRWLTRGGGIGRGQQWQKILNVNWRS